MQLPGVRLPWSWKGRLRGVTLTRFQGLVSTDVTSPTHVNSRKVKNCEQRRLQRQNERTNEMNEPKKSDPTTQVIHEQATATNVSYSQPSQPMVIVASPVRLPLTVIPQAEIISAAQRGDLNTIRELVESGKAKVTDRDEQNV